MRRKTLLFCAGAAGLLMILSFVLHTVTWAAGPVIRQNPAIGLRTVIPAGRIGIVQSNLTQRNLDIFKLTRPISTLEIQDPDTTSIALDSLRQSRIQAPIYGTLTGLGTKKQNFGITVDIPPERMNDLPSSLSSRVTKSYVLDVEKIAKLNNEDRKIVMGQLISNSNTEFLNALGQTDKSKIDGSNWGQLEENTRKQLKEATSGTGMGDGTGGRGSRGNVTGGDSSKRKREDMGKPKPESPPPPPPPPQRFPRIIMLPWHCTLGTNRCGELNGIGLRMAVVVERLLSERNQVQDKLRAMAAVIERLRSERNQVRDKLRATAADPNREELRQILLRVKDIDTSFESNLLVVQKGALRNNQLQSDIETRGLDREKDYREADAIMEQCNRGIEGLEEDSHELDDMLNTTLK